jgi:hypothetical protein
MARSRLAWPTVARVWYLIATIAALDVALLVVLRGHHPAYAETAGVVAIAALFAAAELAPVHVRIGGEYHSISFNELPLALGVMLLTPALLVAAVLVGSGVALVWQRHQRGVKLAFNLVELAAQALIVVGLSVMLDRSLPTALAIGVALIVADGVGCLLVSAAIACHQHSWRGVVTTRTVVFGAFEALTKAALAMAAVETVVHQLSFATVAIIVSAAAVFLGSRLLRHRILLSHA